MSESYSRRVMIPVGITLAVMVALAGYATTIHQPGVEQAVSHPRSVDHQHVPSSDDAGGEQPLGQVDRHGSPLVTQAMTTQNFAPQNFAPQNFAPQNFAPQGFGGSSVGGQGFRSRGRRTADRSEYPTWEKSVEFPQDVFTFARVRYTSAGLMMRGRSWDNDFPDCDWNFSVRLHQLTAMKVDPNGVVLELTDDELFDYPFIYFSNVGNMVLSGAEADALGRYLLQGGFMMADDFWAPQGWENVRMEMRKVFPDREPRELSRDHEIFHLVYDLKTKPQVPSIRAWLRGETFEYWHGDPQGDEGPHFWGYFDDSDRLMALMCHNNDIGDGWEREGENEEYFREYSVRVSYPLGINIVTYAMTH